MVASRSVLGKKEQERQGVPQSKGDGYLLIVEILDEEQRIRLATSRSELGKKEQERQGAPQSKGDGYLLIVEILDEEQRSISPLFFT